MDLVLSADNFWPRHFERFRSNLLRTDMVETDNEYRLEADVPGLNKENVKINLDDDVLTLTAEYSSTEENEKYHWRERRMEHAMKRIRLPKNGYDREGIKAKCLDGVLTVTIPKKSHESNYITIE